MHVQIDPEIDFAAEDAAAIVKLKADIKLVHAHTEAERAICHGDWPFVCPYCTETFQTPDDKGSFPYCSTICAINAENS